MPEWWWLKLQTANFKLQRISRLNLQTTAWSPVRVSYGLEFPPPAGYGSFIRRCARAQRLKIGQGSQWTTLTQLLFLVPAMVRG